MVRKSIREYTGTTTQRIALITAMLVQHPNERFSYYDINSYLEQFGLHSYSGVGIVIGRTMCSLSKVLPICEETRNRVKYFYYKVDM